MNPFKAVGQTITSLANTMVEASNLVEKTIHLAANEVDALEEAQQIRLDEIKFERDTARAARIAARDNN